MGTFEPDEKNPSKDPTILSYVFQPYNVKGRWSSFLHLHGEYLHFNLALLNEEETGMLERVSAAIFFIKMNAEVNGFKFTKEQDMTGTSEYWIAGYDI